MPMRIDRAHRTDGTAVFIYMQVLSLFPWKQKTWIDQPPLSCRSSNRLIMAKTTMT